MTSTRIAACLLSLCCLALPAVAGEADDMAELESLLSTPVYAASKYQQSVADAPAAVTIITQGEIRAFGWRTLAEVLNAVRGVHTRYDHAYSYVGVRGIGRPGDYSSRLLILVDGARLNDNLYDSVLAGREFPLDLDLIERIEFIPGPGSAVHGSNAVLGTINLVTRSAANLRGRHAAVSLDTQRGWKLGANTTAEYAAGSMLLAANVELRPGQTLAFPEFDSPATPGGVVRGQDRESAARLFARFEGDQWSLQALAGRRAKEIPNAPYGLVFGDPAAQYVDSLGLVGLSWHPEKVNGEGWYAQMGVGRYSYGDHGRYEFDQSLLRYTNLGVWLHGEVNHTLRLGSHQLLLLGMDVQRDARQNISMRMLEPTLEPWVRVDTRGTRMGLYASDDITLGRQWQLGLGARLDRNTSEEWTATPRLSLLWRPFGGLTLKALRGDSYRDPNVYERAPDGLAAGREWNDALRREKVSARELVADWQASERLRLSASVYRYDISDMIEQIVADEDTGELVYANVSAARAHGTEIEAEYLAAGGLRVRTSFARQHATNDSHEQLSNSPRWLMKLHATAPLPSTPLRAALELQGMGARLTEAGNRLGAHLLTNVSLAWDPPAQSWSASFTVHNVFDRHVADPGGPEFLSDRIAQDGREATLRLHVSF